MRTLLMALMVFSQLNLFAQDNIDFVLLPSGAEPGESSQIAVGQQFASRTAIRLNVYTTYAFDDKVDVYESSSNYFNGKIKGGFQWGGGVEYMLAPTQSVELLYQRLNSASPMTYYDYTEGSKTINFDLASNYIMLASNRYFESAGLFEPYVGALAGMAIFKITDPTDGRSDSATKFAWGARVGANIWFSEKVGLKVQAGLLSAVQSVGGGFYFGTGGVGAGVNTYSSYMQFNIGGGIVFNL